MNIISNPEIEQFWRALGAWCERVETRLIHMRDWQSLGKIQVISQIGRQAATWDTSTLPKVAEIAPLLADFIFLEIDDETPKLSHFAQRALEIFKSAARDTRQRHEALARRLYAMHQFLDGVAAGGQFGGLRTTENADIHYGLGVSLHDGSLLKLFTTLHEKCGLELEPLLLRTFEDEAPQLLDAIHGGQTSFEQFMQSQLILRYDSALARKVYDVSEAMQTRFVRLGAEPGVRSAQIDLVAGDRFRSACENAQNMGIRSLRGFAMLFDLHDRISGESAETCAHIMGESQKCLSLADAVIARMHGHTAGHWQNRLQSVFHGVGNVDGRRYEESRFFGQNMANKAWNDIEFSVVDEDISVEPCAGKTYVVCPGDRLSALTHRAYDGQGDYRWVLKQNPHILRPESLVPGTRIYFPTDHEVCRGDVDNSWIVERAQLSEDQRTLLFAGRIIRSLEPLTVDEKQGLCEGLNAVSKEMISHTVAVEFPEGGAIVCRQTTLLIAHAGHAEFIRSAASRMACEARHSDAGDAYAAEGQLAAPIQDPQFHSEDVMTWLRRLAAEIRGDIVLEGQVLPLACLDAQPHRQAWMATALKRVQADDNARPLRLMIHAKKRAVDIVDVYGASVLRLENEDFAAIRTQPMRRLADYVAPPIVQMHALSQLWLSDFMGYAYEIAVPPVSHSNLYPCVTPEKDAHFLVPMGTPVYPIMKGTVVDCGMFPGVGFGILVRHHDGLYVRYSSLATLCIKAGQVVMPETMMARSGCLGTEPMLCLEMCKSTLEIPDWYSFVGEKLDYFDIVCQLWPHRGAFEVWMGDTCVSL